jgi:hypothetical protein
MSRSPSAARTPHTKTLQQRHQASHSAGAARRLQRGRARRLLRGSASCAQRRLRPTSQTKALQRHRLWHRPASQTKALQRRSRASAAKGPASPQCAMPPRRPKALQRHRLWRERARRLLRQSASRPQLQPGRRLVAPRRARPDRGRLPAPRRVRPRARIQRRGVRPAAPPDPAGVHGEGVKGRRRGSNSSPVRGAPFCFMRAGGRAGERACACRWAARFASVGCRGASGGRLRVLARQRAEAQPQPPGAPAVPPAPGRPSGPRPRTAQGPPTRTQPPGAPAVPPAPGRPSGPRPRAAQGPPTRTQRGCGPRSGRSWGAAG